MNAVYGAHPSQKDTLVEVERFYDGADGYRIEKRYFSLNDSAYSAAGASPRALADDPFERHNRAFEIDVSKNGRKMLSRQVRKDDFEGVIANRTFYQDVVLYKLEMALFVPDYPYFVFRVNMGVHSTDNVTECFFVMDTLGNIVLRDISYGFCVESIRISPNRRYLITCKGLYDLKSMQRMHKHFDKRGNVVLAAILSDSAYTVVYDYWDAEEAKVENAFIYDFDHRTLHGFRFEGYYDVLQYQALFDQNEELAAVGYFDYENGWLRVYTVPDFKETYYDLSDLKRIYFQPRGQESLDFTCERFEKARFFFNERREPVGYYLRAH